MKKLSLIIFLFLIQTFQTLSDEPKLQEVINGLNSPWSLSFINDNKALVTEKSGNLLLIDFNDQKIKKINHNLKILEDGRGGLSVKRSVAGLFGSSDSFHILGSFEAVPVG